MRQDIKDRVPINVLSNGAIRYGVYDEQGKLLRYEYIKREDGAIEKGTPTNRALFNNMQGDLYTSDRYNKPVVEYGEISEPALVERDIMPKTWVKVTNTEYLAEDGTILTASGVYGSYTPEKIFDDDISTMWGQDSVTNSWVKLEFPTAKKITKMATKIYSASAVLSSAKFLGSNDDETWTELCELTSEQDTLEIITLQNTDFYKFYKIDITNTSQSRMYLYEWQTYEYYETEFYINNLSLPLTSYEAGKIVNIEGAKYRNFGENYQEEEFSSNIIPICSSDGINSNQYGNWNIVASYEYNNKYGYFALDGDESTYWQLNNSDTLRNLEIKSYADDNGNRWAVKPSMARVKFEAIGNIKLFGSNDGENWTSLVTFTSNSVGVQDITKEIPSLEYYSYFKIQTSSFNSSYYGRLYTFEIISGSIRYGILEDEYIDSFENPYLNINNLGAKPINGTIEAGQKYKLVYNGESWDINRTEVVAGSFTSDGDTAVTIETGFEPDLVIAYHKDNNSENTTTSLGASSMKYSYIPRVLTKAYLTNEGKITNNGFTYLGGSSTIYYIAIKF